MIGQDHFGDLGFLWYGGIPSVIHFQCSDGQLMRNLFKHTNMGLVNRIEPEAGCFTFLVKNFRCPIVSFLRSWKFYCGLLLVKYAVAHTILNQIENWKLGASSMKVFVFFLCKTIRVYDGFIYTLGITR